MTICAYCGAERVEGVRTCGALCPRGIDPRLPALLGVPAWQLGAPVSRSDVQ